MVKNGAGKKLGFLTDMSAVVLISLIIAEISFSHNVSVKYL
jgi:hypothetical protein